MDKEKLPGKEAHAVPPCDCDLDGCSDGQSDWRSGWHAWDTATRSIASVPIRKKELEPYMKRLKQRWPDSPGEAGGKEQ